MKTKIIYAILIATILGLCTYIYLDHNKKDKNDDTSNSNITNNSNSNSDITSNIESNIPSNEVLSNSNSNDTSNELISNNNSNTSNITSNIVSNSNIISNSNKVSNTISNKVSNKTSNVTSNKTSNSNTQSGMNTNGVFTGLYQKDNITLKIYQINNKLHYMIYNKSRVFQKSTCTISGNKATCEGNNNTITLNNTSITYSKINSYFTGGTLNKVKNYTIENYYTDFMLGDTSYLNTNNGIYTNNKDSIKLYQLNSNEIFAVINVTRKKEGTRDNTVPDKFYKEIELTKSGNKLVGETAYGQIEITISQGKITVKANSNNIKDILYHIIPKKDDGTNKTESVSYSYQSKYTLNNIVNDHFIK